MIKKIEPVRQEIRKNLDEDSNSSETSPSVVKGPEPIRANIKKSLTELFISRAKDLTDLNPSDTEVILILVLPYWLSDIKAHLHFPISVVGLHSTCQIIFVGVVWMKTQWMSNDFCWSNAVFWLKYDHRQLDQNRWKILIALCESPLYFDILAWYTGWSKSNTSEQCRNPQHTLGIRQTYLSYINGYYRPQ